MRLSAIPVFPGHVPGGAPVFESQRDEYDGPKKFDAPVIRVLVEARRSVLDELVRATDAELEPFEVEQLVQIRFYMMFETDEPFRAARKILLGGTRAFKEERARVAGAAAAELESPLDLESVRLEARGAHMRHIGERRWRLIEEARGAADAAAEAKRAWDAVPPTQIERREALGKKFDAAVLEARRASDAADAPHSLAGLAEIENAAVERARAAPAKRRAEAEARAQVSARLEARIDARGDTKKKITSVLEAWERRRALESLVLCDDLARAHVAYQKMATELDAIRLEACDACAGKICAFDAATFVEDWNACATCGAIEKFKGRDCADCAECVEIHRDWFSGKPPDRSLSRKMDVARSFVHDPHRRWMSGPKALDHEEIARRVADLNAEFDAYKLESSAQFQLVRLCRAVERVSSLKRQGASADAAEPISRSYFEPLKEPLRVAPYPACAARPCAFIAAALHTAYSLAAARDVLRECGAERERAPAEPEPEQQAAFGSAGSGGPACEKRRYGKTCGRAVMAGVGMCAECYLCSCGERPRLCNVGGSATVRYCSRCWSEKCNKKRAPKREASSD